MCHSGIWWIDQPVFDYQLYMCQKCPLGLHASSSNMNLDAKAARLMIDRWRWLIKSENKSSNLIRDTSPDSLKSKLMAWVGSNQIAIDVPAGTTVRPFYVISVAVGGGFGK